MREVSAALSVILSIGKVRDPTHGPMDPWAQWELSYRLPLTVRKPIIIPYRHLTVRKASIITYRLTVTVTVSIPELGRR